MFYAIHVYILTDSHGEWWDTVNTRGGLGNYHGNKLCHMKEFRTGIQAVRYAKRNFGDRGWKVVRYTEPVAPSRTWSEEVVATAQTMTPNNPSTGQPF